MNKQSTRGEFQAEAAGGWEAAEYFNDYSPPPKSANLVAALSWSWSPAHSRYSQYWLCPDEAGAAWFLYAQDSHPDTGEPLYALVASGEPCGGIDPVFAAKALLTKALVKEAEDGPGDYLHDAVMEETGLLDDVAMKTVLKTAANEIASRDRDAENR